MRDGVPASVCNKHLSTHLAHGVYYLVFKCVQVGIVYKVNLACLVYALYIVCNICSGYSDHRVYIVFVVHTRFTGCAAHNVVSSV